MENDNTELTEQLRQEPSMFMMDQKILKPYLGPVPVNYERYRTKVVLNSQGQEVLRVDYDNSAPADKGSNFFQQIAQRIGGLLNFNISNMQGDVIYSVTSGKLLSKVHDFSIKDGKTGEEKYTAKHIMKNLAKEEISVMDQSGNATLNAEYRGFRKFIQVNGISGNAANLYAPVISLRDRWKLEFFGDTDRVLTLIMAAIISELGEH